MQSLHESDCHLQGAILIGLGITSAGNMSWFWFYSHQPTTIISLQFRAIPNHLFLFDIRCESFITLTINRDRWGSHPGHLYFSVSESSNTLFRQSKLSSKTLAGVYTTTICCETYPSSITSTTGEVLNLNGPVYARSSRTCEHTNTDVDAHVQIAETRTLYFFQRLA